MALKFAVRENMAPGKNLRERFENLARLKIAGIELTGASTLNNVDEVIELVKESPLSP